MSTDLYEQGTSLALFSETLLGVFPDTLQQLQMLYRWQSLHYPGLTKDREKCGECQSQVKGHLYPTI